MLENLAVQCAFSTKCHLFHNLIFFCSNKTVFINHALQFNTHPDQLKVKFGACLLPISLEMYNVTVFPIVSYGCETCYTLKEKNITPRSTSGHNCKQIHSNM